LDSTAGISSGDVSFMIVSAALVQLMTPGLGLFYGGLVHHKSVCAMIAQNFISMGIVSVLWMVFLFSLCFGDDWFNGYTVGDPSTYFILKDISKHYQPAYNNGEPAHIPSLLFAMYQCMFAVITPALMTGAFADRLRFSSWLCFLVLWMIFVYAPWCHQIWGGGYLSTLGVVDYAGGIVVHTTAGFSALSAVICLGVRHQPPGSNLSDISVAHNVPLMFIGTALLWFGWFGFNAGSALGATDVAVYSAWNSQIAAAAAMTTWALIEYMIVGKPGLISLCVGSVAGLATITPAAGFIQPICALFLGVAASIVCFACVAFLNRTGIDDALDVWGVHGMGGMFGSICVGFLADGSECASLDDHPDYCVNPGSVTRSRKQFYLQCAAAFGCAFYSFLVTYLLLRLIGAFKDLKYAPEVHEEGIDEHDHGEVAYKHAPFPQAFRQKKPDLGEHLLGNDIAIHGSSGTKLYIH
jgi:Amt family ammonium transporter